MKINELIGVKKFKGKTKLDVIDHAEEEGKFRLLGAGYAGHAFEYKGVVYKFWSSDPPYEAFVKYALANQSNRFLPKILSKKINSVPSSFLKAHPDHPPTVKWIKMELLKPGRSASITVTTTGVKIPVQHIMTRARVAEEGGKHYKMPPKAFLERSLLWEAALSTTHKNLKGSDIDVRQTPPLEMSGVAKEFIKTLFDLMDIAKENGLNLDDVHDENFMFRGDQLVLIDPFWSEDSWKKNQEYKEFDIEAFFLGSGDD